MNLRILDEAVVEMDDAVSYLELQSQGLGLRLLDDFERTVEAVSDRPMSFPKVESLPDDQPYRRALLAIFQYAVLFEIIDDEVVVVALAHTSRAEHYWLGRKR